MIPIQFKSINLSVLNFMNPYTPKYFGTSKLKKNEITIVNQQIYLDKLFIKLKLKTLDDFFIPSVKRVVTQRGNKYLENQNYKSLLLSTYPNFNWEFEKFASQNKLKKNYSIHQRFMIKLYTNLKMNSFEEFVNITKSQIVSIGGANLLLNYSNNIPNMLIDLFPNYPWSFDCIPKYYFQKFENQKRFMDDLYIKLNLKSHFDWKNVSLAKIENNGGHLLLKYYSNDKQILLSSIYPNWDDILTDNTDKNLKTFGSIENRRKFMEDLFRELKLNNLDDWNNVQKKTIIKYHGKNLLAFYSHDKNKMLKSIYPEHNWKFKTKKKRNSLSSLEDQRKIVEKIFQNLNLKLLNDWLFISSSKFQQSGGRGILAKYKNMNHMLKTLYPNHNWPTLIEKQRIKMEKIFKKLQLNELDDYLYLGKKQLIKSGARSILRYYSNNLQQLLLAIYPNHFWNFERLKYRNFGPSMYNSKLQIKRLLSTIDKYSIRQKSDWYRLPTKNSNFRILQLLQRVFPNEIWDKKTFSTRGKKTTQRLLYSMTQKFFPQLNVYEDYRHPVIVSANSYLEFDLFIPSINIAFEYQGEQHYFELPHSSKIELSHNREEVKASLAIENQISLIVIPFWWDQSQSSFYSTISRTNHLSFKP